MTRFLSLLDTFPVVIRLVKAEGDDPVSSASMWVNGKTLHPPALEAALESLSLNDLYELRYLPGAKFNTYEGGYRIDATYSIEQAGDLENFLQALMS